MLPTMFRWNPGEDIPAALAASQGPSVRCLLMKKDKIVSDYGDQVRLKNWGASHWSRKTEQSIEPEHYCVGSVLFKYENGFLLTRECQSRG